jgi:small ligand-binding sensory domain FIST
MFAHAHATHPDWHMALALVAAQIDAQLAARSAKRDAGPDLLEAAEGRPTLGLVYFSDRYATAADALYAELQQRWPGLAWAGACVSGLCASGVEYIDEPALALMLCELPAGSFEVFSGTQPLRPDPRPWDVPATGAWTALVHADGGMPDLPALLAELAERTGAGYLFGGLVSSRARAVQLADGVFDGGLSGVAFSRDVGLISRVTQGCQPIGPVRQITAAEGNVVLTLDDQPALACLLADLGIALDEPRRALPVLRATLVGLSDAGADMLARGQFGSDVRVRHLIGLDPGRRAIAVGAEVQPGMQLAFCQRDVQAARRDLVRICSEIREELAPEEDGAPAHGLHGLRGIAGALYVSCNGRGGPHFGGPSAELEIVRHALGDVPLVGFFASGEIARHHLYGYTGVLTVFTSDASHDPA